MEMTAEEICRNYLQAASPSSQIGVLADLNLATKAEIIEVLKSRGLEVGGRKRRTTTVWTKEREMQLKHLLDQGLLLTEIAAKLGVGRSTVSRKLAAMGIKKRKSSAPNGASAEQT